MAQWFLKPYKVVSIGTLSISNNNTKHDSKINKGYHVPGSPFLSHNENFFGNAVFSCKFMIQRISSIMRESIQLLREFLKHFQKILARDTMHTLNGFITFAYSTLARVHENNMTTFDTDSSFWVCDNSANGHICNNRTLFIGDLVPLIYIVTKATHKSRIDDYASYEAAKHGITRFLCNVVDEIWYNGLKDAKTFYTKVTALEIMAHLDANSGQLGAACHWHELPLPLLKHDPVLCSGGWHPPIHCHDGRCPKEGKEGWHAHCQC
jgi:hypothetical protein